MFLLLKFTSLQRPFLQVSISLTKILAQLITLTPTIKLLYPSQSLMIMLQKLPQIIKIHLFQRKVKKLHTSIMTGLQLPQKILGFPSTKSLKWIIKQTLMLLQAKNLKKPLKTNTESKSQLPILHMKINTNWKSQPRLFSLPSQFQINTTPPLMLTILLHCLTTITQQILTLILSNLQAP